MSRESFSGAPFPELVGQFQTRQPLYDAAVRVAAESPVDGTTMYLTPEVSVMNPSINTIAEMAIAGDKTVQDPDLRFLSFPVLSGVVLHRIGRLKIVLYPKAFILPTPLDKGVGLDVWSWPKESPKV